MSSATESVSPSREFRPQRLLIFIVLIIVSAGVIALISNSWRQSLLLLIGGLLGVTLYHSSFGFASAYRKLIVHREVNGMYAQLVMLAIATLLFAPFLATGSAFGQAVKGAVAPVGVQGAIGALLFEIGMQFGGACGCGTLYTIGGSNLGMLLTLITFCVGAFWASLTRQLWAELPSIPPITLGSTLGWTSAVIVQIVLFAGCAVALWWWGGKRKIEPFSPTQVSIYGSWSLFTGAIALAVLNTLTLVLSGQPWRITWGFALWAAQFAQVLGWNPQTSPFWRSGAGQQALSQGVFADVSSIMNFGIVLGAILAAALAGRWQVRGKASAIQRMGAIVGGLVMGYGAFLAFGCNVSAFFGGIASTSVHGWVWIVSALLGTMIGVRLRPLFRLEN